MKKLGEGFALPLVILLLLVLGLFGHGILLLSLREMQATWSLRHLSRANDAARLGLQSAAGFPLEPVEGREPWASIPLLSGETSDGMGYSVVRRWLDQEFFLLESTGTSRGWPGERNIIWVGWAREGGVFRRTFLSPGSEVRHPDPGLP